MDPIGVNWQFLMIQLLVVGAFCGFLTIVAVVIVGAMFVLLRNMKAGTPPVAEQSAEGFFEKHVPTLRAWDRGAFADLSNRIVGWWRRVGNSGLHQGVIRSLSQPEQGWMAYQLDRHTFRSGVMRLRTAANEVALTFRGGGQFETAAEVDVTFDGAALGTVRLPHGEIIDVEGQQIGQYTRRQVAIRTMHYAPVTLNGRQVAQISDIWVRQLRPMRATEPAMREIAADLSEAEARWLLALLGVELYYDALWERRRD